MLNKVSVYKNTGLYLLPIVLVLFFSSCTIFTVVKNEPAGKPYIFETNIKVDDARLTKSEKLRLEGGLYQQLDDSIAARKLDKVFWKVLKNPQVLDSSLITKSMEHMNYYLNGEGYFHDSISFTTAIENAGAHQKARMTFHVKPGPVTRIDSLAYTLLNDSIKNLVEKNTDAAFVKEGDPFAQAPLSAELDRLVELHRNNGYLLFSRNQLYVLWDTMDLELLVPEFDPFEQAMHLQKLKERVDNPIANIEIRQRPDSTFKKYYVGNVTVYPDTRTDTLRSAGKITTLDNVTVIQRSNKFRPHIFPQYIYLKRGELYRQNRYMRTLNRFNALGTWRLVDIAQIPRDNTDTVDFEIQLNPAPKYNFTTNLESSFSESAISGRFVGIGVNVGLQNRNFLRSASQFNTNVRYGVELGGIINSGEFIQAQQVSLSNSLVFPRFVFPGMHKLKRDFRGNIQSVLTLNAANTERRYLFNLTSFNTAWGYDFTWRARPEKYAVNNRTYSIGIKIPNIEYSYIKKRDRLLTLIDSNPSIKNLFSDGLITSVIANFSMPWNSSNKRSINVLKLNLEASGLLTGMVHSKFIDEQLYRFIKADAEYAKLLKLGSQSGLVLRGFAGIGYELESTPNPEKRTQLPFFKQYFSGGPNSMRAWQLRRLGPGSTIKKFDGPYSVPDRFGDVQLEANIEYRMPLFNISGIPINGALFTDIGNVWLLKKDAGLENETFKLSRLGTDLAIGAGAGIRADFGFFVIRLDYAYKVKDPSPDLENAAYQNKFFAYPFFKGSQLQVGIGYPFIF